MQVFIGCYEIVRYFIHKTSKIYIYSQRFQFNIG